MSAPVVPPRVVTSKGRRPLLDELGVELVRPRTVMFRSASGRRQVAANENQACRACLHLPGRLRVGVKIDQRGISHIVRMLQSNEYDGASVERGTFVGFPIGENPGDCRGPG